MPVEFPPECPPAEAAPKPGTYYRLAQRTLMVGDETTAASWLRPYETRGTEFYKKPDLPEAHGLSIFASLDDVHAAAEFSSWVRSKSVAEITISGSDGDLLHTPVELGESHHDWWTNPYDLAPVGVVVVEAREEAA